MNAIIFGMPIGAPPVLKKLPIETLENAHPVRGIEFPAVFAFNQKDIEAANDFFKKQQQPDGKQLWKTFGNKNSNNKAEKPLLISTKYTKQKPLLNAIQSLLEHANEFEEKGYYLISLCDQLFNTVKTMYHLNEPADAPQNDSIYEPVDIDSLSDEELWAKDIIDLLEADGNELIDDPKIKQIYRGSSYACRLVRHQIAIAAENDETVLILGGTGTGKELIAKEIHNLWSKNVGRKSPFIAKNISTSPSTLFEEEFFGHEKGSFTDAKTRKEGLFEKASGGTLFLDEIGDLPSDHQAKILRVLEEKKIFRVGAVSPIDVDVRIIAATNMALDAEDEKGTRLMRLDLYNRFSQIVIRTPSLESHREDIPDLAKAYWKKITENEAESLPKDIIEILKWLNYDGNVRELEKILKGIKMLATGNRPTKNTLNAVLKQLRGVRRARTGNESSAKVQISRGRIESPDVAKLIDILANISHAAWRRKKEGIGYTYGSNIDDEKKTHPHLKDYARLSEEEKSYSKEEAKAFLKGLLDRGYVIR